MDLMNEHTDAFSNESEHSKSFEVNGGTGIEDCNYIGAPYKDFEKLKLRSTQEIPSAYRSIFEDTPYFNVLQSSVLDDVFYSDKSIVVCAPTGSGKTMLFELAIVRMLIKCDQLSQLHSNQKVVYMAPIKALCSQRHQEWQEKFGPVGLKCMQLTGDSNNDDTDELLNANIILTTPEKWDSTTRRWHANMALIQQVQLFLVDEVHLLNDENRGATMEATISRMKTKHAYLSSKANSPMPCFLRFVGVSATIPNVEDIAKWLSTPQTPSTHFTLAGDLRPVKLDTVILGYPCYSASEFKFDISLNYKLKSVIDTYSSGKPTLVFCSTRKSVEQAAARLSCDSRYVVNATHQRLLNEIVNLVGNQKLRDCMMKGVGFHHAGLDLRDRQMVEKGFTTGRILVLLSTSTLAMGVNLPAHLVIVKSTSHYVGGICEEYSQSEIMQMIGRAGRPQFDTSATAVIMTKQQYQNKYENLVSGTRNIESSLHKHLIEHLNAEIALGTIPDTSFILEWIRSTFLYVRVLRNPTHYGYRDGLKTNEIEHLLHNLCINDLEALGSAGMVNIKDAFQQKILQPTLTGRLMAQYCIAFETMKNFGKLSSASSAKELISLLAACKEYQDITLRVSEKSTLNQLNKSKTSLTIRYPMEGKIKNTEMKVNCLLQTVLGNIPVQDFGLQQDITKIFRTAIRVSRCFMEFQFQSSSFESIINAVKFVQAIKARMWGNSSYICRQLPGIGPVLASLLSNAGVKSFADAAKQNPRDLELILNRHPPFGNQLLESIRHLPVYDVSVQSLNSSLMKRQVKVTVSLTNCIELKRKQTIPGKHCCVLLVGHSNGSILVKQKISDAVLLRSEWSSSFELKNVTNETELIVAYCSQDWVGLDVEYTWSPFSNCKTIPSESNSVNEIKDIPARDCKESKYFNTNRNGPRNRKRTHSSISKSCANASSQNKKKNIVFSSQNISNWMSPTFHRVKTPSPKRSSAFSHQSSEPASYHFNENPMFSSTSKENKKNTSVNDDPDETEADSAISIYLDMMKNPGRNILATGNNSIHGIPPEKLPTYSEKKQVSAHGKSVRKKLVFNASSLSLNDSMDAIPDFDLSLDWDGVDSSLDKMGKEPELSRSVDDTLIALDDDQELAVYLDATTDDSFDSLTGLAIISDKQTPDDTPVSKTARMPNSWLAENVKKANATKFLTRFNDNRKTAVNRPTSLLVTPLKPKLRDVLDVNSPQLENPRIAEKENIVSSHQKIFPRCGGTSIRDSVNSSFAIRDKTATSGHLQGISNDCENSDALYHQPKDTSSDIMTCTLNESIIHELCSDFDDGSFKENQEKEEDKENKKLDCSFVSNHVKSFNGCRRPFNDLKSGRPTCIASPSLPQFPGDISSSSKFQFDHIEKTNPVRLNTFSEMGTSAKSLNERMSYLNNNGYERSNRLPRETFSTSSKSVKSSFIANKVSEPVKRATEKDFNKATHTLFSLLDGVDF